MSWVSIDDEVGAILHALTNDSVAGPVNVTGPAPVTNAEFTQTLGRVVRRPTVLPTPLLPLKVWYGGELIQHLLVEGQRVLPKRLEATGYRFAHPTLEEALRAVVDRH
jgi:NAD dependent epimerase/dehydratase family enzyme